MSGSAVLASIERDAARAGFRKQLLNGVGSWVIECSHCHAKFSASWSPQTSPALMIKNMRNKHWAVGNGTAPICATCINTNHTKRSRPMNGHVAPIPPTTPNEGVIERKVYAMLESHFDDATRAYVDGYTDTMVAEKVGCSVEFVIAKRRKGYGEIEDPRLQAYRAEYKALVDRHVELATQIRVLGAKLDGLFKPQRTT